MSLRRSSGLLTKRHSAALRLAQQQDREHSGTAAGGKYGNEAQ